MSEATGNLSVPASRGRRVPGRRRWWLSAGLVVALASLWWATHPPGLPAAGGTRTATTPSGVPVYVAAFTLPAGEDHTLHLLTATTDVSGNGSATAVAQVCHGGSPSVTSDAAPFCDDLVNSDGADLGPGDTLVVEVSSTFAGTATVDHVGLTYREGLRWGRADVGPRITVTILPRRR